MDYRRIGYARGDFDGMDGLGGFLFKLSRRKLLWQMLKLPFLYFLPLRALADDIATNRPFRVAFGSCADQNLEQPIWDVIRGAAPDLFAFIGDNIYADTEDMSVMRSKYQMLGRIAGFRRFRAKIPMIFTWDDHDFGINDGGREYPFKAESKKIMFQFFGEDLASPRARRDGVYTSYVFGKAPRRTQIILLDLRWFRSALIATENGYIPNPDPDATMLGAEQWKWLEEQLRIPADFRILASSTQFVSSEHGWEKWANFPHEKARLLRLIDELNIKNLAIISGDMHYGELSMETTPGGFNLYDLSSSGLNFTEPALGIPNSKRLGIFDADSNFGMVSVDFANPESILVTLEVRDSLGETVIQRKLEYPRGPALTS